MLYLPRLQPLHDVAPSLRLYLPAEHCEQESLGIKEYLPA